VHANLKKIAHYRQVFRFAAATIVFIAAFCPPAGRAQVDPPTTVCSAKYLTQTVRVDQFVFKAYEAGEEHQACLEVRNRNGELVYRRAKEEFGQFTLGQPVNDEYHVPAVPNGTDVTGRGRPDMIVSDFTGGAHCCSLHFVFELEPYFKLLATLNDADDDLAHFTKLAGDTRYYYSTADWAFAYWPADFAASPSHSVLLRFVEDDKGGHFHLALDKMKRSAPTPAKWNENLADVKEALSPRGSLPDDLTRTLWDTVLDLIYTGHSDLAWKFLDEAGPKAQAKPLPNLEDFCGVLKTSLYWPDLEGTLQNPPPACTSAKLKSPNP
jgi:hypothetical protein